MVPARLVGDFRGSVGVAPRPVAFCITDLSPAEGKRNGLPTPPVAITIVSRRFAGASSGGPMNAAKIPIAERPFVQRMIAIGALISVGVGALIVVLFVALWTQDRRPANFHQAATFGIPLALLVIYWLAARYTYFSNDRFRLGSRVPSHVREAMLWYVIVMSFILGAVVMLAMLAGGGSKNLWKEDENIWEERES